MKIDDFTLSLRLGEKWKKPNFKNPSAPAVSAIFGDFIFFLIYSTIKLTAFMGYTLPYIWFQKIPKNHCYLAKKDYIETIKGCFLNMALLLYYANM